MKPRRKVGPDTVKKISKFAASGELNFWHAINEMLDSGEFAKTKLTESAVAEFIALVKSLARVARDSKPTEMLGYSILQRARYLAYVQELDSKRYRGRTDREANINELMEIFRAAESRGEYLEDLVDKCCLVSDADGEPTEDRSADVVLSTLHSAKGLEFPAVFIAGCEDGFLPDYRDDTPEKVEESRRLFFVGMTRAEKFLILTHANKRRMFDQPETPQQPSRFLAEIPDHLLNRVRDVPAVA
jgi:DNA helicase II / ATP-dependent DNA helicase PcrA